MTIFMPLATGPFFSFSNPNFMVLIAFLIFVGILIYYKVPGMLTSRLDARAEQIRKELDDARLLREEAQTLLASFERKQKEVSDQAAAIVSSAKHEADNALVEAKADLEKTIERRLHAAEEQIASAEQSALREVKDRAVTVAVEAAAEVIARKMDPSRADALIDEAIEDVRGKLH